MTSIDELRLEIGALKKARRSGARRVLYGSGASQREVEYRSDRELAAAIAAAEAELARATGARPVMAVLVRSTKGW